MNPALEPGRAEFSALVRSVHPQITPSQQRSGWHSLKRRALLRDQRVRRFYWLSFSFALAGAALALGIYIGRVNQSEPMSYVMGGGQIIEDGQLRTGNGFDSMLRFSDGSTVRLGPKTRGRLVSVSSNGARVRIADGEAEVSVAARAGSNWEIDAGPYAIFVHGTALFVHWSEPEQTLEVRAHAGTVEVDGPLANDGIVLRGGQLLTIRRAQGEIVVRDAASENPR